MKRHCYPSFMVPYTGLIREVNVDNLLECGDFALARRIDKPFSSKDIKIFSDGSGIVTHDASLISDLFEHTPNMSMTMLRKEYPIYTAMYDLHMKSSDDDWNGGGVKPWKYRNKARKVRDCFLMVYKATCLHGMPSKYQTRFENLKEAQDKQEYYEMLKDDIVTSNFKKSNFYKGTGHISLRHSPTALNYWHYELVLVKTDGDTVRNVKYEKDKKPEQMNLKQSFVNYVWNAYLCKNFWVNNNPCKDDIPMSCFFDKRVCNFKRQIAEGMNKCMFSIVPIVY